MCKFKNSSSPLRLHSMNAIPSIAQPILNRLEIIYTHWFEFVADTAARICIWELKGNDLALVNAFLVKESSDQGETNELFLTFESPFDSPGQYQKLLEKEWQQMMGVEENRKAITEHKVGAGPNSQAENNRTMATNLENQLHGFASGIPQLESFIVIVLMPQNIGDYQLWLSSVASMQRRIVQQQLDRVRVMITVPDEEKVSGYLGEQFPARAMRIKPNINLEAAIEQMAAIGDPKQLDVQFRTLFTKMHNTLLAGDYLRFFTLAEQAKKITKGLDDWLPQRVAIEIAIGGANTKAGNPDHALKSYQEAEKSARKLIKKEPKNGKTLLCQVLIGMGTTAFTLKDYPLAIEKFKEVISFAQDIDSPIIECEAIRMLAHSTLKEQGEAYQETVWKLLYKDILLKAKEWKIKAAEHASTAKNAEDREEDNPGYLIFNHTDGPLPLVGVMLMAFAKEELTMDQQFLGNLKQEINEILRPGWEQVGKIN